MSLGVFPISGRGSVLTPDLQASSETPGAEAWRFNDLERPRSNASLKVGNGDGSITDTWRCDWHSLEKKGGNETVYLNDQIHLNKPESVYFCLGEAIGPCSNTFEMPLSARRGALD